MTAEADRSSLPKAGLECPASVLPTVRACLVSSTGNNVRVFFRGQFAYLHERGFHFTVVTNDPSREALALPKEAEYRHVPLARSITPLADLRSLVRLFRLFRRERFDLVQYTTPKGALLGSIAAWVARVPVRLFLLWGLYYVGQKGLKRRLFKAFDRLACRLSTHVTFDGFDIRDFAVAEGLCTADGSSVVGQGSDNGIDLAVFDPARWKEAGAEVRRQWQISADAVVIGSVMRLVGDKGINELVAAFQRLAEESESVYLLLVGRLEDRNPPLPETLAAMKEDPRIIVTGYQLDVLPYYAAMDVFALPTYREGFSAVNLEAAAMTLPVVTTDAVGARESIVDGETGFCVPVADATRLCEALGRLVGDPVLRRRLGAAGRRRVERDFEQSVFWDALHRHRESLLVQAGVLAYDGARAMRIRPS